MRRAAKGPALRRVSLAWPGLTWVVTSDEDAYEIELRANVETPDGVTTIDVWQYDGAWRCAPSVVLDVGRGTILVTRPDVKPSRTLAEAVFAARPNIKALAAFLQSCVDSTRFNESTAALDGLLATPDEDAANDAPDAPKPVSVSEQLRVARAALLHLATHGVP